MKKEEIRKLSYEGLKDEEDYAPTPPSGRNPPRFCLLYTSPSPRDRTRSRMPSSA